MRCAGDRNTVFLRATSRPASCPARARGCACRRSVRNFAVLGSFGSVSCDAETGRPLRRAAVAVGCAFPRYGRGRSSPVSCAAGDYHANIAIFGEMSQPCRRDGPRGAGVARRVRIGRPILRHLLRSCRSLLPCTQSLNWGICPSSVTGFLKCDAYVRCGDIRVASCFTGGNALPIAGERPR